MGFQHLDAIIYDIDGDLMDQDRTDALDAQLAG